MDEKKSTMVEVGYGINFEGGGDRFHSTSTPGEKGKWAKLLNPP